MLRNEWKRKRLITTNIYIQVFVTLGLCTLCHCTDVVTARHSPTVDTSGGQVSNVSSGAVDYKTWQQENIDSKLYIGHGIFLYKDNNTNSSDQDWRIKTDDIPKLYNFGFPAANADESNEATTSSGDQPVRSWVLALACFVGFLLIVVAITVSILARKWMLRSMNRRRRHHRHILQEQDEVVVEANPGDPKISGPSTICQGLPRPLPRLGILPDDGLPPYTRLESPTRYSSTDETNEGIQHHPLDLPLPSYSEIPAVHTRNITRTIRHLQQPTESNRNHDSTNFSYHEAYSLQPPDQAQRTRTSLKEDTRRFYRQSSSSSNHSCSTENKFIPHWCEGEDPSALEESAVLPQNHPGYHRQQLSQQEKIEQDKLSVTESSLMSNHSNRQFHHFPTSSSSSSTYPPPPHPHMPMFIPEGDGFPRDEVSTSRSRQAASSSSLLARNTTHPLPQHSQFTPEDEWSLECGEKNTSTANISKAELQRVNHSTSGGELLGNDVRRKSLPSTSSGDRLCVSRRCMTQENVIDCNNLSDIRDGMFIAE